MSKLNKKGIRLGSLQKKIILHLASTSGQTINETKKALSSHYKPTWIAFNSLKRKGLIEKSGIKSHRGNDYPLFWLTFEGLFLALIEGVDPKTLEATNEKLHGTVEDMDLVFELARILPSEELGRVYNSCKFAEEGMEVYLPVPMNPKSAKIWREALKKSPKYQKIVHRILEQALGELPKGVEL